MWCNSCGSPAWSRGWPSSLYWFPQHRCAHKSLWLNAISHLFPLPLLVCTTAMFTLLSFFPTLPSEDAGSYSNMPVCIFCSG